MVLQSILTLESARRASNFSVWSRSDALFSPTIKREWKNWAAKWDLWLSMTLRSNTHLESQGVHLFVRDFPWTLCPLLLCCPFIQLCLVQPEGGDFFLKDPCTNDNKEVLLLCLGVKIHFNLISRWFHTTPFGVNLLFGKWWPFAVRHYDDIMNVQSETLEQSHHSEQKKTFFQ